MFDLTTKGLYSQEVTISNISVGDKLTFINFKDIQGTFRVQNAKVAGFTTVLGEGVKDVAHIEVAPDPKNEGQFQFWLKGFGGVAPAPEQRGGRGGGGKSYTPRYTDTPEGFRDEQRSMNRRTALMQAVAIVGPSGDWKTTAEDMMAWLESGAAPVAKTTAITTSNGQDKQTVVRQFFGSLGMEQRQIKAFKDACQASGKDWPSEALAAKALGVDSFAALMSGFKSSEHAVGAS